MAQETLGCKQDLTYEVFFHLLPNYFLSKNEYPQGDPDPSAFRSTYTTSQNNWTRLVTLKNARSHASLGS